MKRLLVTGSRHWRDPRPVEYALREAWYDLGRGEVVLVHGAEPNGLDTLAAQIWEAHNLPTEAHPADWGRHGKKAGPIRNQEMVDRGADLCLAFPLAGSRGTVDCMQRAEAAYIEVRVVQPRQGGGMPYAAPVRPEQDRAGK